MLEMSLADDGGHSNFGLRVALFYGALFVIYGVYVPFLPIWLDWRGVTAGGISVIMAAPFFIRLFVTPAVAMSADESGRHRLFVIALAVIGFTLTIGLSSVRSFWPIFMLCVPMLIATATMMPLIETIAVSGMRRRGLDYGQMRLWGSLTFVAASFAGGAGVSVYGRDAIIVFIAIGGSLSIAAAPLRDLSRLRS